MALPPDSSSKSHTQKKKSHTHFEAQGHKSVLPWANNSQSFFLSFFSCQPTKLQVFTCSWYVGSGDSGLYIFSCRWEDTEFSLFLEGKFPHRPCWPSFSNSRGHFSNIPSLTTRRYKGLALQATPRRKTIRRYRIHTRNQKKLTALKAQADLWEPQVVTRAMKPKPGFRGGFPTCLPNEQSPTMLSYHLTCKRNRCIFIQGDKWWVQNDCGIVLCYDPVIRSLNPWLVLVHWKTMETKRSTFKIIIWIHNNIMNIARIPWFLFLDAQYRYLKKLIKSFNS